MLIYFLGFFAGMILLYKLSDYAVDYSVKLSRLTGIMKLTIGVIVIAVMTSLPELSVSITASFSHAGSLVYGTMVGSNIADILTCLGFAALIYTVRIDKKNYNRAVEIILITSLVLLYGLVYGYDSTFGFLGLILFGFLSDRLLHKKVEHKEEEGEIIKILTVLFKLIIVIVLILLSAELVTKSSIALSDHFGISETLIGSTIVGFTTSLPELAVVLAAAKRRERDILFGTVFGSCFINIVLVLAIGTIISPIVIGFRDKILLGFLIITYLISLVFMRGKIERFEGFIMVFLYVLFIMLMGSLG